MMWRFPMKPVRIDDGAFDRLDLKNYTMERKYDGFRLILEVDKGIRLFTREKNPLTIPDNLKDQLDSLGLQPGTILDGEIWNTEKRGSWRHDPKANCSITFWDITSYQGCDLSLNNIEQRREILSRVIQPTQDISVIDILPANKDMFSSVREDAYSHRAANRSRTGYVHGVVLKKKSSPRRDHVNRSMEHADWLKVVFFQ